MSLIFRMPENPDTAKVNCSFRTGEAKFGIIAVI